MPTAWQKALAIAMLLFLAVCLCGGFLRMLGGIPKFLGGVP